jgi:uncharacterized protein (DUF305 family)
LLTRKVLFVMTRTIARRFAVAGTALVAGFALSACGDSSGKHGSMPDMGGAVSTAANGSATATFNEADMAFAQHMIVHHQQAVEMAALADSRATDAEVKKLSAQIKAAQSPEIATMTGWLSAWGQPTSAAGMEMGHDTMPGVMSDKDMKKLEARSGKEFDKEFLTMMIAHHEGAIEMAKEETSGGRNPDAKALAQQISTSQQAEIDTMKQILTRL